MVNRTNPRLDFPSESDAGHVTVAKAIEQARAAQCAWAKRPLRERLKILRRLRHRLAANSVKLAQSVIVPNRTVAETLIVEILPLADSIKFLERSARRLLKPVRHGLRGRPLWLAGTELRTYREPFGVVLIVAPRNYPLLLAGSHAIQALAAGNAVLVKASPGHGNCIRLLRDLAESAGLDPALMGVCDGDATDVYAAIETGVDKVVLTGSARPAAPCWPDWPRI